MSNNSWYSIHIFYYETTLFDKLIIGLSELLNGSELIEKWFYIRYWKDGPQIRLRMAINDESTKKSIYKEIQEYCSWFWNKHPTIAKLNREEYYKNYHNDSEFEKELVLRPSETILEIKYVPEVERYGGSKALSYQEDVFYYSSLLTLRIIKMSKYNYQLKYLISVAMVGYIIKKLVPSYSRFNLMASIVYDYWESIGIKVETSIVNNLVKNVEKIESIIAIIQGDKKMQHLIECIEVRMKKTQERLKNDDYLLSIISSQLHMFNNRLGISPYLECHTLKFWEEKREMLWLID